MSGRLSRLWAVRNQNDEWWSSFVTAPLGVLFCYVVADIKWLTPNMITLVSVLIALVSVAFILMGGSTNFLIAAVLIHVSHILDCMDGQFARYRHLSSALGSYFDRATDQIQVILWFGAVGYAASEQFSNVLPIFLAFVGVAFYSLRGYVKYVSIQVEMSSGSEYIEQETRDFENKVNVKTTKERSKFWRAICWFVSEQQKILRFDEGVFIFMLSLALVLDRLMPMLWLFAASQVCLGLLRTWQRGQDIARHRRVSLIK